MLTLLRVPRYSETYVDVEISVINVETVCGLLEVEVANTILACVVIVGQTELSIRSLGSNEVASSLLRGSTSPQGRDRGIGIDLSGVLVLSLDDHTELVKVNGTFRDGGRAASVRVGVNTHGGHGGQSGDESGTHDENEGLGTREE